MWLLAHFHGSKNILELTRDTKRLRSIVNRLQDRIPLTPTQQEGHQHPGKRGLGWLACERDNRSNKNLWGDLSERVWFSPPSGLFESHSSAP